MLSRLKITALALALSATLSACSSSASKGTGGVPPSTTPTTMSLTVEVRAASGAPDDFGLVPGNTIAGAAVEVGSTASPDSPSHVATTDEFGSVALSVPSGSYQIKARKNTHDPLCWWYGGTEVEVTDKPVTVELYDLWVLCE